MTNLEKYKASRIKEIEEMSINEVAEEIRDEIFVEDKCIYCIHKDKEWEECEELSCKEGIKQWLEKEAE